MTRRPPQRNRTAPVLGNDRRLAKLQGLEQRLGALAVAPDRVELGTVGLVGATEPEMVERDRTVTRLAERPDEVAIQVRPSGVAVGQHDGGTVAGTLVDVVHPAVGRIEPMRLVGPGAAERPVDLRRHANFVTAPPAATSSAADPRGGARARRPRGG